MDIFFSKSFPVGIGMTLLIQRFPDFDVYENNLWALSIDQVEGGRAEFDFLLRSCWCCWSDHCTVKNVFCPWPSEHRNIESLSRVIHQMFIQGLSRADHLLFHGACGKITLRRRHP